MKQLWLLVSFATLLYFTVIQAKVISKNEDPINDNVVCKSCRQLANNFLAKRRAGATKEDMFPIFKDLCVKYMLVAEDYCIGIINQQLDTALYIIDNRPDLTAARICALYLQYKECIDPKLGNWTINIPEKQNTVKHNIRYETNKTHLKVLQLTDMHFDSKYKTGSNSKCSKNLCCRENSGEPAKPEDAAGYWGSYGLCDIPWHTVEETLNHIKTEHKDIDFVYFTGDIISHTGYETSIEKNTNDIKQLFEALKDTFGTTPIYPVLGNHEPHPPDFYSPENVTANFSTQWLYKLAINEWSSWIPSNTSFTLSNGGFYTFLLKPGYRLIAMNNNVGYLSNLWIIFNDNDPFGELQWLVDTLYESEKKGECVHLIGHIEPGDNLVYRFWMHQFHRILRRFSKTIKAQINGHSHMDEFKVVYNENNPEEVVHYAFISGSVTTFVGFNPMYRIYKISPETFEVMDYVQYTFNLTDANLTPKKSPKWYKQYTFLKEYGLNEISTSSINGLVERLKNNGTLAYTYFKNQIRYSDLYLKQGCDAKCLQQKMCRMTSIEFEDAIRCFD